MLCAPPKRCCGPADSRSSYWQAPILKEPRTCDSLARPTRAAVSALHSQQAQRHQPSVHHHQFVRTVMCGVEIRTVMQRQ